MRDIKFDLIYKGDNGFHHKKYHLSELMEGINKICDIHHQMELIATRQFTGLQDKNCKDIYEGDIVKGSYLKHWWIYIIQPCDISPSIDERTEEHTYKEVNPSFGGRRELLHGKDYEVIGNIYQNPELLEA